MKKKSPRRRGSALVIVLGILAVMMLMAVAFSTFVRTERGGSTNLKNAFVARTSLFTAVGRAMEAIDLSFGSATNDDPVAAWPQPWLASAEGGDHFQSAILGEGETAGAHVLTDKIAKHLTPAQLALARAAKCNWAPIYSSINASSANSARNGGRYGNYGRPTEDSLIGRYAFIALDTTGLLDMNQTGLYPDDRSENSGDPLTFDPPSGTAQVTKGNRSVDAPPFVVDPGAFLTKRETANLFHSMADAKTICGKSVLAIDEKKKSAGGDMPDTAGDFFPADLFAGFAPSLAETSPEGTPKVRLPSSSDFESFSNSRVKKLMGRVFRAMIAVFARSRAVANIDVADTSTDDMPIYQSVAEYSLSPAALATVSLMDGLDSDNVPGRSETSGSSLGYWKNLVSSPVKVEGTSVSQNTAQYADLSNLDFPCTESAPLVDAVRAEIKIESVTTNGVPLSATSTVTYNGKITVSAYAHCLNKTESAHSHKSKIKVEWEVMEGDPLGGTVSGDGNHNIRQKLEGNMTVAGGGSSGTGRPDGGGGGSGTTAKAIDWSGFFEKSGASGGGVMGGSKTSSAGTVNDGSSQGDRFLFVESSETVKIVCHCYSNLVASGGTGGGTGRPGQGGGATTVEWKPYPMTAVEYNKTGDKDVFVPIRVRVSIIDGDASGDKIQQQVPGPRIDTGANEKRYWVRVEPGVYHSNDSSNKSQFGGNKNGSSGDLAYGWAFCAVPTFGFDTTSLLAAGNTMNFWLNDKMVRQAADEAGGGGQVGRPDGGGGGGNPFFSSLKTRFWSNSSSDPNKKVLDACLGVGRGGGNFGFLQRSWLFNTSPSDESDTSSASLDLTHVTSWMSKGGGRAPDLLHSSAPGGDVFVVAAHNGFSAQSRNQDSYSRIPVDGYATVADLGRVICGPYETLSLFKTWRPNSGRADFHPVMDYFTMEEDRYPKQTQVDGATGADGEVNWTSLGQGGKDLYSAIHNGRVNLNAPPLVELTKDGGKRGRRSGSLNPYPIAAALNAASVGTNSTIKITEDKALILASTLCKMLEDSDLEDMKIESEVWPGSTRKVVRNLSFLGMGQDTMNTLLDDFVHLAHPECDIEREGMLGGIIDAFSTRGQTYLVIIRADAYSPKFGENDSVQDGTTLATTHAIVELFRDPVPAHAPDGVLLPSDGEGPVAYHNWYIRSFRVF